VNILSLRGRFFLVIFIFFILGCSKAELTKKLFYKSIEYKKKEDYENQAKTFENIVKIIESDSYSDSINIMYEYGFYGMDSVYWEMGNLFFDLYKYDKAIKYFKKAKKYILQNSKKSQREKKSSIATYNISLARAYNAIGLYDEAIKILEENTKFSPHSIGYLDVLSTYMLLKNSYINKQEFVKLKTIVKKLIDISKHYVSQTAIFCDINMHIGEIYMYLKEYNKADIYYSKCLHIAKQQSNKYGYIKNIRSYQFHQLIGGTYLDLFTPNFMLGKLYLEKNNYEQANKYFNEAKKAIDTQQFIPKSNLIELLIYQSIIALKQNKLKLSEYLLKKSINLKRKINGENSLTEEYIALSNLYELLGNNKKSYSYMQKAFNIFLKNLYRNFTILDSKEKREYINKNRENISFLLKKGFKLLKTQRDKKNITKTIFNSWLKYKGTIFEYQNILSTIYHNTSDKRVKNSIDKLKRLTIELDNLDNSDIKPKKYNEIKESIEEKIHNIEVNLSKENQRFKEQLDLKNIDYKEIAKNLKDNQLYIDFAKGKDNYYIFTLDNRENITFKQIDKNQTEVINKNIKEFLDINKKIAENINSQKLIRELKPKTDRILSKLYNLLIDKNIEDKKEIDRLIISSDGIINFLPFETLFDGKNYLIEKYTISYISSGREFIRQIKRKNSSNHNKIVIFANMDFQLELPPKEKDTKKGIDNITIFDIDSLSKLDATEEIKAIKSNFKNIKIYQEENATVENIFKIKSPKILHISTHGIYLNNKNILNPMRRSALAFSGADNASYIGDARGFATALKLSSLDLEGTELVVLSACESGLGVVQEAEGVIGLPKAFIQAGAKNVVISLWKVSNNKSALLMKYFYDNIAKGKDYTTALRDAKLKMLSLHPYFWGAFIIYGI